MNLNSATKLQKQNTVHSQAQLNNRKIISEIKFGFSQIYIPNINQYFNILQIDNPLTHIKQLSSKLAIKIKFYSFKQKDKLFQKIAKVNIQFGQLNFSNSAVIICKYNDASFKVSYPQYEQNEIVGKIYLFVKKTQKEQIKNSLKFLGSFKINLFDWFIQFDNKKNIHINDKCNFNNPQIQPILKFCEISQDDLLNKIDSKNQNTGISQCKKQQQLKLSQQSRLLDQLNEIQEDKQQKDSKPWIYFKIINANLKQCQTVNQLQKKITNQRNIQEKSEKLKIVRSIINESIFSGQLSKQIKEMRKNSQISISQMEGSFGNRMKKARSEILFNRLERKIPEIFNNDHFNDEHFNTFEESHGIILGESRKKSFKQKIKEILKEVKVLKEERQMLKLRFIEKSEYKNNKNNIENKKQIQNTNYLQKNRHKKRNLDLQSKYKMQNYSDYQVEITINNQIYDQTYDQTYDLKNRQQFLTKSPCFTNNQHKIPQLGKLIQSQRYQSAHCQTPNYNIYNKIDKNQDVLTSNLNQLNLWVKNPPNYANSIFNKFSFIQRVENRLRMMQRRNSLSRSMRKIQV